ncbi:MAG: hypothetical protein PHN19_03510 [Patescibacteria group bacterium]|nr:hypothetical protein [Patescibacteria group bacterium]
MFEQSRFTQFITDFQSIFWGLGIIWSGIGSFRFPSPIDNFYLISFVCFIGLYILVFPYLLMNLRRALISINMISLIPPVFLIDSKIQSWLHIFYLLGFIFFLTIDLFVFISTYVSKKTSNS